MADPLPNTDKSLGDKLLGFFIKEDSNAPNVPASRPAPNPAGSSGTTSPTVAPIQSANATGSAVGAIDTKFVDHFAAVLGKANLQGPDYFEFREILRNLSNLGLPEEKQFQAAWASFKAMAAVGDPAMLTTAANQYLAALGTDRDSFLKSVEMAMQERVGGLQTEQKKLLADNDAIAKQITELQQRATTNNDRLAKISGEVIDQSSKINQNRANFETTYATFTDQIKADVSKIATYLK